MGKQAITTDNAPAAVGTYSQAMRCGDLLFISGQIPLDPVTGQLVDGGREAEIRRVFDNVQAIAAAAGGSLSDVVKLSVFLTDLGDFALVNQVMMDYFEAPFPARAAMGVAALPLGAQVEVEAIVSL
jgi:reactive intermediate/imine deaminase